MNQITLLTSFPADYTFGGGAILRFILPAVAKSNAIKWYYIQKKRDRKDSIYQLREMVTSPLRMYTYYPLINRFQNIYHSIHIRLLAFYLAIRLKRNDKVWVVLENEMIALVYFLLKFKKIRLHVSVHDDCLVGYDLIENNVSRVENILTQAESVDLIGENLRKYYKIKFNIDGIVYRRGVNKLSERISSRPVKDKEVLKLLFVGSSHSDTSWNKLFRWLAYENGGHQFEVWVFSNSDFISGKISVPENVTVRFNPSIDENQLVRAAAEFDLSIFFWNDFNQNRIEYSVSTKLTTYLQLGLPMVASISKDAEVFNLFEYGVAFNFENPESDFVTWLSGSNFRSKINKYIDKFFNKERLNDSLLALPFFGE